MPTKHNGTTERILDYIRHRGMATRRDLREALGVKASKVGPLLALHIDAGVVSEEHTRTAESRRLVVCYRWNPEAKAGEKPKAHRRSRLQTKKCLCCADDFLSDGPMNRLCNKCRTRSVSPYAP